jgi:GAF domain-containing protein
VDGDTPLGTVLNSGTEVWLRSLSEIGTRYPLLLEDTVTARLESTTSLPLRGRDHHVIGALGVGWPQPQRFLHGQRDELPVVAQLAADALSRAQLLAVERSARRRTERLQRTMTALVASATLAEVTAAVFVHGLLPFGASAARLALVDQQQPEWLVTLDAIGLPESVLTDWQSLPAGTPCLTREATATSAMVYVPTLRELAGRYPEVGEVLGRSGHQAWVALPLLNAGRTIGVLTLAFPRRTH